MTAIVAAGFCSAVVRADSLPGVAGGKAFLARAEFFLLNHHAGAGFLDSCGVCLDSAARSDRSSRQYLELKARYCLLRGDEEKTRSAKLFWYRQAEGAARELIALAPNSAPGRLWYGTVQVRYCQVQGIAASVAAVPEIRRCFEKAVRFDSGYALGWYALGRFYQEMPAYLGGNLARAESCYVRGLRCDPHLTLLRASYAQLLADTRRKGMALVQARQVLAEEAPSNPAEYYLYDLPRTRALIEAVTGRRKQR